jgi:hypothetical protein
MVIACLLALSIALVALARLHGGLCLAAPILGEGRSHIVGLDELSGRPPLR